MKFVLILVAIGVSQSYQRADEKFAIPSMQEFDSKELCVFAAQQAQKLAGEYLLRAACVPKGK